MILINIKMCFIFIKLDNYIIYLKLLLEFLKFYSK